LGKAEIDSSPSGKVEEVENWKSTTSCQPQPAAICHGKLLIGRLAYFALGPASNPGKSWLQRVAAGGPNQQVVLFNFSSFPLFHF
jgi:hypothetical protein